MAQYTVYIPGISLTGDFKTFLYVHNSDPYNATVAVLRAYSPDGLQIGKGSDKATEEPLDPLQSKWLEMTPSYFGLSTYSDSEATIRLTCENPRVVCQFSIQNGPNLLTHAALTATTGGTGESLVLPDCIRSTNMDTVIVVHNTSPFETRVHLIATAMSGKPRYRTVKEDKVPAHGTRTYRLSQMKLYKWRGGDGPMAPVDENVPMPQDTNLSLVVRRRLTGHELFAKLKYNEEQNTTTITMPGKDIDKVGLIGSEIQPNADDPTKFIIAGVQTLPTKTNLTVLGDVTSASSRGSKYFTRWMTPSMLVGAATMHVNGSLHGLYELENEEGGDVSRQDADPDTTFVAIANTSRTAPSDLFLTDTDKSIDLAPSGFHIHEGPMAGEAMSSTGLTAAMSVSADKGRLTLCRSDRIFNGACVFPYVKLESNGFGGTVKIKNLFTDTDEYTLYALDMDGVVVAKSVPVSVEAGQTGSIDLSSITIRPDVEVDPTAVIALAVFRPKTVNPPPEFPMRVESGGGAFLALLTYTYKGVWKETVQALPSGEGSNETIRRRGGLI